MVAWRPKSDVQICVFIWRGGKDGLVLHGGVLSNSTRLHKSFRHF